MKKYIFKRMLMLIPVLLGISFVVFSIMSLTPGDPAQLILGESASEEAIHAKRQELGLNDPFIVQYFRYVSRIAVGDFGRSYSTNLPVWTEIWSRFPNTLVLTISSVFLAIFIGIPIGIFTAVRQYSLWDSGIMLLTLLAVSMPVFWFGLMLILLFSLRWELLPAVGQPSFSWHGFKSIILPTVSLGTSTAAVITRMTRSSMLDVVRQDYIRTARAKGVSEKNVIYKHAFRNALIPVLTVIGIQFGTLLGGAILTESVFSWPGIGRLLVEAIRQKDTPRVMGVVIFLAAAFSVVNLVVDILYAYADPRIKSRYK
ncbi:peptide/nickel transport system permease protein [Brevinema andersonii]|uniref:Peptide/nickel transport system permease protein n=1 Tax=Brevinema andersonii TaxID=34097 RepID=A0A1I1E8J5_BREAD|nr:ABC transporter permease [Brevinema andersonii]SFB81273.1 peptide/nickel transport system permease protein [Brevinema andersonii]